MMVDLWICLTNLQTRTIYFRQNITICLSIYDPNHGEEITTNTMARPHECCTKPRYPNKSDMADLSHTHGYLFNDTKTFLLKVPYPLNKRCNISWFRMVQFAVYNGPIGAKQHPSCISFSENEMNYLKNVWKTSVSKLMMHCSVASNCNTNFLNNNPHGHGHNVITEPRVSFYNDNPQLDIICGFLPKTIRLCAHIYA